MNEHISHPIVWNEELSAYIYVAENYNGPSTKKSKRIASALSLEHYKVRQLELIAQSLAGQKAVNDDIRKQISNRIFKEKVF